MGAPPQPRALRGYPTAGILAPKFRHLITRAPLSAADWRPMQAGIVGVYFELIVTISSEIAGVWPR